LSDSLTQWIGIGAGALTSASLLPQFFKIKKDKKAENISIAYLITLLSGLSLWVVYGFLRKDIPVIATNIFSVIVNISIIFLSLKYKSHGS